MAKMISILMAVYNCPQYLRASIGSILNQTIERYEFIVVDDGSDASVAAILDEYTDQRLRIIRVKRNIGLTGCLNIALDVSIGDILARHDADDIALPTRLERELTLLTGRTGLVSCWAEAIDEDGNVIDDPWIQKDLRQSVEDIDQYMPVENRILAPGAIFTRDVFHRIGYFDPVVKYAQDYNYWLRLIEEFAIDIMPEVLVQKRIHQDAVWSREHEVDWKQIARDRAITNPKILQVRHPTFARRR